MSNENTAGSTSNGTATLEQPVRERPRLLPQWKVLLHNDDVNEITYVAETVTMLTPLNRDEAALRTTEAHKRGVSLIMTTHREHAELLEEQFRSRLLMVTIEPE